MSCSSARIARLRAACAEAGLDAFLVRDTSSIRWLTAFDDVFDEERAHALLISADAVLLHTDSRYVEAARKAALENGGAVAVNAERVTHAKFAAQVLQRVRPQEAGEARASCLPAKGGNDDSSVQMVLGAGSSTLQLGIEDGIALREYRALQSAFGLADEGSSDAPDTRIATPAAGAESAAGVAAAPAVQLRETSGFVQRLRAVKDADEVSRMRAAQAVTDAAFSHIIGFMKPGMTEREVQLELDDFMRRAGAEGLAFPSIVATGENGASPHAVPGQAKLQAGQCVVMDFGARARGYCSDMTRTVFLGEPSPRMREAYAAIRAANEQVEALLAPGVTGKQAHELAERILADHGFEGKMGHALGHSVGIDIHEDPSLAPRNSEPLEIGNVVTVEPGVYLSGEFGMRLEDFGVVTADGFDVFTKSTHEMVIL